ncbi:MAG: hypothetical protein AAGA68_02115 [Pseudomonadota bacterium]
MTAIPVTRMSELSTGAQLILWAARHLVGAAIRDKGTPWCVPRSFEIAGAASALESLKDLVVAVAQQTPRQLVVANPSAGQLTRDEVTFAAALTGDRDAASVVESTGEEIPEYLSRLREVMASAGLPLTRLGTPDRGLLRSGRAPAMYANPGLADLH